MAAAVEHKPSFQRSHSADLLSKPDQPRSTGSKTLPSLPAFDVPSFDADFQLDTSKFVVKTRPTTGARNEKFNVEARPRLLARARTSSIIERPKSWFVGPARQEGEPQRPTTSFGENESNGWTAKLPEARPLERGLAVSESLTSFAKRSWRSAASRSPSPRPSPNKQKAEEAKEKPRRTSLATDKRLSIFTVLPEDKRKSSDSLSKPSPTAFTRASSYFARMKPKQAPRAKELGQDSDSCASSVSLAPPASNSVDTAQSIADSNTTHTDESEMAPRRDPLWSSFRVLDTEFKSFPAKQTNQRVTQIQSVVLQFLRNTSDSQSLNGLKPEDVEWRATILNKWWVAVLEMLEGQPRQMPLPGVERPGLYEVATLMMLRAEWRELTPSFRPLERRSPNERNRRPQSWDASSQTSRESHDETIAESAEHNVRTMFTTNLVRHMAFIADKLSLRHAPMDLVNFAAKSCAYAFFFAPGVSEILARLWPLNLDLLRRTADELDLGRTAQDGLDDIQALFPPHLGGLSWSSPKSVMQYLKKSPQMSMQLAQIPWTGPWSLRWKGRDTDLFFIFCKHFHILTQQFLPPGLPMAGLARTPAFGMVHAQVLYLLDTTIHRPTMGQMFGSPQFMDYSPMTMSMPPPNVTRGMSENRLIVLLKEFLIDDTLCPLAPKQAFAKAFAAMVKGATRKTSQFSHAACFVLCDILEEVLTTLDDFEERAGTESYIDWDFWLDVWRKMLGSLSTMAEIRVLAFVYTTWELLAKDPERKAKICLEWLLEENVFETFFNHWCPMVRAYYHRLLCWRICRDEGSANEVDMTIFVTAASRLRTVFSHYLHLKQTAEDAGRIPPSTAPVYPTPGKKFTIILQEVNTVQSGLFIGFDQLAKKNIPDPPDPEVLKSDPRKRWSLLGRVLSFTGPPKHSRSQSWDDDLVDARREIAELRSRGPPPPPKVDTSVSKDSESTGSSPIFEPQKHIFRFFLGFHQSTVPPRERLLIRPRLPAPAQARVSTRTRSGSPPPAACIPAATRLVSGSPQLGLVHNAKNSASASPVGPSPAHPPSLGVMAWGDDFTRALEDESRTWSVEPTVSVEAVSAEDSEECEAEERGRNIDEPIKPTGVAAKNAAYTGRALAEWGQIVYECNAFVDRRREEGILGLKEVEVPLLGVEGFRKPSG